MNAEKEIIEKIKNGAVILYPTDTTFGLGCNANNPEAVEKIFKIKKRPASKSFILLVESERRLQDIVDVPDLAWDIIDLSEKPVTIVYDNPRGVLPELVADDNTLAIRLTKDPFCKRLISRINAPLVSTSVNFSGEPSPQNFSEISQQIKDEVDYIFPECHDFVPRFKASSIIKLSANGKIKVIRE